MIDLDRYKIQAFYKEHQGILKQLSETEQITLIKAVTKIALDSFDEGYQAARKSIND